ncbi:MAG: TIGR03560 family F420-dependent LLM class oxidoreductase [Actinomycetota bacterium]|nr:TIGR03560 family F420-dependent LLM class oxidoreductase [Actinomycetota bacterium]
MQLELMIEGQEDVTWEQWVALARACEQHGVGTLFRSDHYLSVMGHEERGSLETWTTLAGLAAITTRLRFGVLVSPATFRHPSVLAKAVAAVDHISGGRVDFGLGAGWNEREHEAYGFEFPPLGTRLAMLEEQLEVVCGAWADGPFSFAGEHYELVALDALPKPVQRPRPPIIIGGAAKPRTARMAARFADEYNTVYATPAECAERRAVCEQAWRDAGRDPSTLTFSVMLPWVDGTDPELMAVVGESAAVSIPRAFDDAVGSLRAYRDAGVDRIMLQHLRHAEVEAIAEIPRLSAALV